MTIPESLTNIFALIGLFFTVHVLTIIIKNTSFYLKHKKLPKNLLEKKLELLTKENQRLADQVKKSEKESEEMTKAVINKLR